MQRVTIISNEIMARFIYFTILCYLAILVLTDTGVLCENTVDFCSPDPCENNGTCANATSSSTYNCSCAKGWTGINCTEVHDPCNDDPHPCSSGNCSSAGFPQGEHNCTCPSTHAGSFCEVELNACDSTPCANNAACKDLFDAKNNTATFECSCDDSWTGFTCNVTTEMSIVGKGSAKLDILVPITAPSSISFDVKTTNFNGVLVSINSSAFSGSVSLKNDRLLFQILHSNGSTLETLTTDDPLDASVVSAVDWLPFRLEFAADSVVNASLGAISASHKLADAIPESISASLTLSDAEAPFFGCLRKFRLEGESDFVSADDDFEEGAKSVLVSGCQRTERCSNGSCSERGQCADLWNDFRCDCNRPYFGRNCSQEIEPITLRHNKLNSSSGESFVLFNLTEADLSTSSGISVSIIFKTVQSDGLLFFLGDEESSSSTSYLAAYLKSGQLIAAVGNSSRIIGVSSTEQLNDGKSHSMTASLDSSKLKLIVDKDEFEDDAAGMQLPTKELFYVGGMKKKSAGGRRKRAAEVTDLDGIQDFKGTLQDPSMDGKRLLLADQSGAESDIPDVKAVPASTDTVVAGERTDDLCGLTEPCLNGGNCTNKPLNDFECDCAGLEFEGKTCQFRDPCKLVDDLCPVDMKCENVDADGNSANGFEGYNCDAVASFVKDDDVMSFTSDFTSTTEKFALSLSLKTRSKKAQIAEINFGSSVVKIEISEEGKLFVKGDETTMYESESPVADAVCRIIRIDETEGKLMKINCSSGAQEGDSANLTAHNPNALGSLNITKINVNLAKNLADFNKYEGCLRDVHLFGVALPIFEANKTKNEQKISFSRGQSSATVSGSCVGKDVCASTPCKHQDINTCEDRFNQFECKCITGFSGDFCETAKDICNDTNPCVANNTVSCYTGLNDAKDALVAKCQCNNGFSGETCASSLNPCDDSPCQHGGNCTDVGRGHFYCQCPSTHVGKDCATPVNTSCDFNCTLLAPDKCFPLPCSNGGTCEAGSDGVAFNCTCPTGFEGHICEYESCASSKACSKEGLQECVDNKWKNDETGETVIVGHTCFCKTGWEGKSCDKNIDECTRSPGICKAGVCKDLEGSFECDCAGTGFTGSFCGVDINECDKDPCKHGSACKNRLGSYQCDCREGYVGDNCADADCSLINCTGGQCLQTVDSDGVGTSWSCDCTSLGPYVGGEKCEVKHKCHEDTNPCDTDHTEQCVQGNETDKYTCKCKPGYNETTDCKVAIDYCLDETCSSRGNCSSLTDQQKFACSCNNGYNGDRCENDIDECAPKPCKNGATCSNLVADYTCDCTKATGSWQGKNCEVDVKECSDVVKDFCNVKHENGSDTGNACNEVEGSYKCECSPIYGGTGCKLLNACAKNDTICNKGSCEPDYDQPNDASSSGVKCNCTNTFFEGPFCAKPLPTKADSTDEINIIIGVCVALAVVAIIVGIVYFCKTAKSKRANRGTYSPSNQEIIGSRVEMGNIIKPPPEERLI